MAQLYPAQAEAVQALLNAYQDPELTFQHHLYISGEMGVGKTYMASAVVAQLKPKRVLIVCPSSMPKKWQSVYEDFTGIKPIIFKAIRSPKAKSKEAELSKTAILKEKAVIVNSRDLYLFVKKIYQEDQYFVDHMNKIAHAVRHDDYNFNLAVDLTQYFDFIICDEIHTYKPTMQTFRALAYLCQTNPKLLGLTGTLFKQNIHELHTLLALTNPEFNNLEYSDDNLRDPAWFYPNIWRYISVPISLHDVEIQQAKSEEDIKQDIMPLKGLTLSDEQRAWYDLATLNLKRLGIADKRRDQVTTSYLDLPQVSQPIVRRSSQDNINLNANHSVTTHVRNKYATAMTLKPIRLDKTPKFKQLTSILKENPTNTIIFVQDTTLGRILVNYLDKAFVIPNNLNKAEVAEYVNSRLDNDYDVAIATVKQISTGIDLNSAHQIIWYQVPSDVTTILQAQRRVLRLNSTEDSKVWFLYYKDTAQEQTIIDASNSATNNAAAYNVRAKDNLAKVTGILFGNIDDLDDQEEN